MSPDTIGIVILLFVALAAGGYIVANRSKKNREKRRAEEAARTDGTPYDPNINPDQIPGDVWSRK